MRYFFAALFGLLVTSAYGAASLDVVDYGISDVIGAPNAALTITTDVPTTSLQVAIGMTWDASGGGAPGFGLLDNFIIDPLWTPVPGDNPYTGTETTGLYFDATERAVFASYQANNLGVETLDLFEFEYLGSGALDVFGVITEDGVPGEVIGGSYVIDPNHCSADFEPDGDVDITDFGHFADSFGSLMGDANYDLRADCDRDGDIDIIDFGLFADNFGVGFASAVPELSTLAAVLIAFAPAAVRRSVRS